jgi:uncharacterized membrane protein YkoI
MGELLAVEAALLQDAGLTSIMGMAVAAPHRGHSGPTGVREPFAMSGLPHHSVRVRMAGMKPGRNRRRDEKATRDERQGFGWRHRMDMDIADRSKATESPRSRARRPGLTAAATTAAATTAAAAAALVGVLAGCSGEAGDTRREVIPAAEVEYSQAIRTSVAEVPRSELIAAELQTPDKETPVWRSRVATDDGTVHVVRLDASTGRLLGTESARGQSSSDKARVRSLLERATIRPEEAVREVTEPDFGKVSAVELGERNGRVIWSVDVVTVEEDNVHVYTIDATNGKVLNRAPATDE